MARSGSYHGPIMFVTHINVKGDSIIQLRWDRNRVRNRQYTDPFVMVLRLGAFKPPQYH